MIKSLYIFVGLLFFSICSSGQKDDQLRTRYEITDADQLYLLPSKDIYETGEDMWFKAWLLDRQSFALSGRSRTLYLRIYSPDDSLVWDEKYPIINGRSDGHVLVGENWKSGEYKLEGYAKSAFFNDSTDAIYPRRIYVVRQITDMDSLYRIYQLKDKKTIMGNMPFSNMCRDGLHVRHDQDKLFQKDIILKLLQNDTDKVVFKIIQRKGKQSRHIQLFAQMRGIPCCAAKGILKDSITVYIQHRSATFPVGEIMKNTAGDAIVAGHA